MMVIGLTGGIASGKSTVAAMLRKANIPVIDADDLAREVTQKGSLALSQIVAIFGSDVLAEDQSLDRKKLGNIVFHNHALLKKLEAILHPAIKKLSKEKLKSLKEAGHQFAIYVAPLIFETGLEKELSKTILITTNRDIALKRASLRDQASFDHIEQRMNAQLDEATKKSMADQIIENNGSLLDLFCQLQTVWKNLTGQTLPCCY
jgi:dephospho-CoA kinase